MTGVAVSQYDMQQPMNLNLRTDWHNVDKPTVYHFCTRSTTLDHDMKISTLDNEIHDSLRRIFS